MAISGQTELDGRHSCDSGEDTAFLETLRRSKMPTDREEMLIEASMSSSSKTESKIRGCKGVTRQLYGRLQKHRRQFSSFSNKQSKRISTTEKHYESLQCSDEEISKKLEDIRRYEQTCIDAIERITRVACKMQRNLLKRSVFAVVPVE